MHLLRGKTGGHQPARTTSLRRMTSNVPWAWLVCVLQTLLSTYHQYRASHGTGQCVLTQTVRLLIPVYRSDVAHNYVDDSHFYPGCTDMTRHWQDLGFMRRYNVSTALPVYLEVERKLREPTVAKERNWVDVGCRNKCVCGSDCRCGRANDCMCVGDSDCNCHVGTCGCVDRTRCGCKVAACCTCEDERGCVVCNCGAECRCIADQGCKCNDEKRCLCGDRKGCGCEVGKGSKTGSGSGSGGKDGGKGKEVVRPSYR